jgi:hypothetical protein
VEEHESEFRATLTKRTFLSAIGAMGLVSAIGMRSSLAAGTYAVPAYDVDPNVVYDVIVIGAGTAGLPLAMCAAQRGRVLVIDRGDDIGGTLFSTGGLMSAAGTNLQKRHGIHDTPDMHYEETMHMGHGKANPEILRLYVDNAADTINWLEDLGVKWRPQDPSLGNHAVFKTRRYHGGVEAGMSILKALLPGFIKAEAAGRIRVLLRTSAVELTQQRDGAISGVIAQGTDGKRVQYKGRNIVLTSGGCMRSPTLFKKYHGKTLFTRVTYAHSLGHGLELGSSVGAGISGTDLYIAHRGAVLEDRDYPSPVLTTAVMDPDRRLPWEVEVNHLGERYVAEDADINTLERALTNQVDIRQGATLDAAATQGGANEALHQGASDVRACGQPRRNCSSDEPAGIEAGRYGESLQRSSGEPVRCAGSQTHAAPHRETAFLRRRNPRYERVWLCRIGRRQAVAGRHPG